jgi:hypothetical protein
LSRPERGLPVVDQSEGKRGQGCAATRFSSVLLTQFQVDLGRIPADPISERDQLTGTVRDLTRLGRRCDLSPIVTSIALDLTTVSGPKGHRRRGSGTLPLGTHHLCDPTGKTKTLFAQAAGLILPRAEMSTFIAENIFACGISIVILKREKRQRDTSGGTCWKRKESTT